MTSIANRLLQIKSQILHAEIAGNREPGSVLLLAVSKTKPTEDLISAYIAGQRHFGESYVQEALTKQQKLTAFNITWHFIGPIQSNKTKLIATHFNWVHSVDRLKIARRLSDQRPDHLPPLNLCLQINISNETTKSGVSCTAITEIIGQILELPKVNLRGVMAIPAPQQNFDLQRQPYRKLYQAISQLQIKQLDTFSFGMTGDLQAAIMEGSTMVRVGTAIFGKRTL
jgi:pyridoxal phosphate enzyme (YggS family)